MDKFRQYKNYGIIAIASLFCLFFIPFTGSTVGMGFVLPDTVAGWIVYVVNKLIVAAVNMLILYCFCAQGKYNVRNDSRFKEAQEILLKELNKEELKPKSPRQHNIEVFGKKGVSLFITSILGTVSLTQAVLTFDWVTMLTYFFVITSGIIFGVIQMGYEEAWWTEDYWKYAKMIEREAVERVTASLESPVSNENTSTIAYNITTNENSIGENYDNNK